MEDARAHLAPPSTPAFGVYNTIPNMIFYNIHMYVAVIVSISYGKKIRTDILWGDRE